MVSIIEFSHYKSKKNKEKELIKNMTNKQILFCKKYAKNMNIRIAAIMAGYSRKSAYSIGWNLLTQDKIIKYISYLWEGYPNGYYT